MLSKNGNEPFKDALRLAQQERMELLKQLEGFEKVKQRLEVVDSYIRYNQMMIGEEPQETVSPPAVPVRVIRFPRLHSESIADRIYNILKDHKGPMTLSELLNKFREKNWPISKANPKEVLRYAMRKKDHTFKKIDRGIWDLTERSS